MASTDGTPGQDAKFGEMFGSGYGLEGGAHADWIFAFDPASEPALFRTAPSAMDVAQRRQAKDHLEYMLRRRRRDIAEEVEVMDREDPYEKPENNPDDMDNISTTNFRYSQIPRLQTEIRTIQADLNQVRGESLEGEGYGFI